MDSSLSDSATKSAISEYSEYIQYLISVILLFVFYKKFISSNEISLNVGSTEGKSENNSQSVGVSNEDFDYEDFSPSVSKSKLKNKIRKKNDECIS